MNGVPTRSFNCPNTLIQPAADSLARELVERRFIVADDILATLKACGIDDHLRFAVIEDLIDTSLEAFTPAERAWCEGKRYLLLSKHGLCG
jgi:hypothetical protein